MVSFSADLGRSSVLLMKSMWFKHMLTTDHNLSWNRILRSCVIVPLFWNSKKRGVLHERWHGKKESSLSYFLEVISQCNVFSLQQEHDLLMAFCSVYHQEASIFGGILEVNTFLLSSLVGIQFSINEDPFFSFFSYN